MRRFFSFEVRKLPVDGGFTCPNRDGKVGVGGCTFCLNEAFSPDFCRKTNSISAQLNEGKCFFDLKRTKEEVGYLAYFQSYTGTYASIQELRNKFDEALLCDNVVGLVIGTRPDCIGLEVLDLLKEISRRAFVLVELGVESLYDEVLLRVNRGHNVSCSRKAVNLLSEAGIHVGVHLILGLPGVSRKADFLQVKEINKWPIELLKLHQLQLFRGTVMADEYLKKTTDFNFYSPEEYVEMCVDWLRHLRSDIAVDRWVSEAPSSQVLAPRWGWKPARIEQLIRDKVQSVEIKRI